MINNVSQDIHRKIFNSGIHKIKDTFEDLCNKNEFYGYLMKNIGNSILKITFDPNVIEICRLYTQKLAKSMKENRDSTRSNSYIVSDVPNKEKMLYNRRTSSQNSFSYDSSDEISACVSSRVGFKDEAKGNLDISNNMNVSHKTKGTGRVYQHNISDFYKEKKSIP